MQCTHVAVMLIRLLNILLILCMCMQLERAAVEKWGSMPEVEAERNAREQKRLKRALEHAGNAPSQKPYMHVPMLKLNNMYTHASNGIIV